MSRWGDDVGEWEGQRLDIEYKYACRIDRIGIQGLSHECYQLLLHTMAHGNCHF